MRPSELKVTRPAHDTTQLPTTPPVPVHTVYNLQYNTVHSLHLNKGLKKELRFHSLSTEDSFPLEGPIPTHIEANINLFLLLLAILAVGTAHQSIVLTTCASLISHLYLLLGPQQGKPQSEFKIHSHRETFVVGETNRQDANHEGFP